MSDCSSTGTVVAGDFPSIEEVTNSPVKSLDSHPVQPSRTMLHSLSVRKRFKVASSPPLRQPSTPMAAGKIEQPTREYIFVPPSAIYFTQRSITGAFADGKPLKETFDCIAKREIRKRDLPMINAVWLDKSLWTLNNRRLAVFSELQLRNFAKVVKIRVMPFEESAHADILPFVEFRKRFPKAGRPVPDGLPDGWGGNSPVFSPDPTTDLSLLQELPVSLPVPAKTADNAHPQLSVQAGMPPLQKCSSSEEEPHVEISDLKRRNEKPRLIAKAETSQRCICGSFVNVINRGRGPEAKSLSMFFMKNPKPLYPPALSKPPNVKEFICGCGHEEDTLSGLEKHKGLKGHACWSGNAYDSLREMMKNEDLRITTN